MTSHRDGGGVNPLRPYYIPPTIGEPPADVSAGPGPNPFSHARGVVGGGNATGTRYASKARDLFADIDYKEYISEPSPSAVQTLKELLDESLWKYISVLMAQPFEVAKTILQVRSADGNSHRPQSPGDVKFPTALQNEFYDSDSENDELSYFTSNIPGTPTPSHPRGSHRQRTTPPLQSPRGAPSRTPSMPTGLGGGQLVVNKPDSVLEVISALWNKEGTWGVWKASNATFVYSALQSLMENWSRSLLCALFNVPDLGVRDDVTRLVDLASPYPWASFFVAAGAAVATGLMLAPLDLVRMRLILTSVSRGPRRSIMMLRNLPSYACPPALILPTILHSLVHPVLTLSTPLMLRTRFGIDRELSPTTFSISKFCSSTVALFVKLPLETVLRRGQAAVLARPQYVRALDPDAAAKAAASGTTPVLETIVPCGRYDGMLGTMRHIVWHEGTRSDPAAALAPVTPARGARGAASKKGKNKVSEAALLKGQGMEGLWRGWKVNWWGLVGLWAAGVLGGGGDGEF